MKISLRKWKCLRWLELGPPLSWSHVRTGAGVAAVVAGADLGRLGRGEIHMARQAMLLGQTVFSGWRSREGNGGREGGGVCNEVASPVNSWSQGHKVSDAVFVYIRDEPGGIPPNTTHLQCNEK